jgi:uncharacterized protein with von Willebrand factor type A (vWA) domain
MSQPADLILIGVLEALNQRGLSLSTRDYLDALRALECGFGCADRQDLQKLAVALWARCDEEERLIRRAFAGIPHPSPEEVQLFESLGSSVNRDAAPEQVSESRPPTSNERGEKVHSDQEARVEFESRPAKSGIPLPPAPRALADPDSFILEPQTVISRRRLAVVWRRFRKMSPSGARIELDVGACISEQCRVGALQAPILRPDRINLAKLAVLADLSPSMSPWRPFIQAVSDSLAMSGLRAPRLRYFENDPLDNLFGDPLLQHAEVTIDFLRQCQGSALLVVSDAGAARGFFNPARLKRSRRFLEDARQFCSAIVWIVPMPRARWANTTAGGLARSLSATFLPLSEDMLVRAVDILRGTRNAA